jgi:hypothetical protein
MADPVTVRCQEYDLESLTLLAGNVGDQQTSHTRWVEDQAARSYGVRVWVEARQDSGSLADASTKQAKGTAQGGVRGQNDSRVFSPSR